MMGIMKYDAGCGENKNWLVSESAFDERYLGKCEALFAQGNGYLGVRNALEEAYTGTKKDMFVTCLLYTSGYRFESDHRLAFPKEMYYN